MSLHACVEVDGWTEGSGLVLLSCRCRCRYPLSSWHHHHHLAPGSRCSPPTSIWHATLLRSPDDD
ncbi:hypothetical protein K438DRAFT_1814101, partial [Mycena galopus ATCC 62051]